MTMIKNIILISYYLCKDRHTALMLACDSGHDKCVDLTKFDNVNINAKMDNVVTALMLACLFSISPNGGFVGGHYCIMRYAWCMFLANLEKKRLSMKDESQ